jgi:hypothetical protein
MMPLSSSVFMSDNMPDFGASGSMQFQKDIVRAGGEIHPDSRRRPLEGTVQ